MKRFFATAMILLTAVCSNLAAGPAEFELTGIDAQQYKLSDYRGKWVLVNYWATWCPPCLEEIPELEIFHNNNKDTNGVVLGVNMEEISDRALKKFVEDQFVSYPILRARPAASSPLGRISGLPTSFLISPSGEIVAKQTGTVTAEAIESFIANYKKQQ